MRSIDVRDLLRRPGSSRAERVAEPVQGLRMELAVVPMELPVEGDLLLESLVEGILVSGRLRGTMRLRCARCLGEFEQRFDIEVSELFMREPDPEEEHYSLAPDGVLDMESMVRDAVVLAMPFSPLCRADCKGICERCGGDRNLAQCECGETPADPRWAGLERLFSN
jgi:uncharacterized protein